MNQMEQNGIQVEEQVKRLLEYYIQLRKQLGISQSELERLTGMSRPAINRYENGKLMPTVRAMNRLLAPMGYQLGIIPLDEKIEDTSKKEDLPDNA